MTSLSGFVKKKSTIASHRHYKKVKVLGDLRNNKITLSGKSQIKGELNINFRGSSDNNELIIGDDVVLKDVEVIFNGTYSVVTFENGSKWSGTVLVHGKKRTVRIGENTTCINAYLMCRDADINIGKNCMLSRGIEIRSSDVHKIYCLDTGDRINNAKNVVIDDSVWIAADVTVSKGAYIPKGSVVGAKSFVNKPYSEENVILAGSPAKIVKKNIRWER